MLTPRRETTSVDAAIIGTDTRVGAELSPGRTPLRERARKARAAHRRRLPPSLEARDQCSTSFCRVHCHTSALQVTPGSSPPRQRSARDRRPGVLQPHTLQAEARSTTASSRRHSRHNHILPTPACRPRTARARPAASTTRPPSRELATAPRPAPHASEATAAAPPHTGTRRLPTPSHLSRSGRWIRAGAWLTWENVIDVGASSSSSPRQRHQKIP
jgi:hypothetical protein